MESVQEVPVEVSPVEGSPVHESLDETRQKIWTVWQAMAPGWDRKADYIWDASRLVGEWLVAAIDPRQGQTVLELAAGSGDTGFLAAQRIGAGGRLISTDFAPEMVGVARRRAEDLGIANADFRVLDAERSDLETHSVDAVLCRWGYMLMVNPEAALVETRRVLRPGGRLALSVWASPAENPWASLVAKVLVDRGLLPRVDPETPGGIFSLARRGRLEELLAGAGFADTKIEKIECRWRFHDFDEYWAFLIELAGAVSVLLVGLSPAQRATVREAVLEVVEPFRSNGGYDFPGMTLNACSS